jgi:hypothetical protein
MMCRLYKRYVGTSITHLTEKRVSCSAVSTVPNEKEVEIYENIPNILVAAPVTHLLCIMCAPHGSTMGCTSYGELDMNYNLILLISSPFTWFKEECITYDDWKSPLMFLVIIISNIP